MKTETQIAQENVKEWKQCQKDIEYDKMMFSKIPKWTWKDRLRNELNTLKEAWELTKRDLGLK